MTTNPLVNFLCESSQTPVTQQGLEFLGPRQSHSVSLEAAREASVKGAHSEVTLEDDVDLLVEQSLGMGHSSITFNTATSDEVVHNEECKYYEVDQVVFEEKLVPRGTESRRHMSSPRSKGHEEPWTEIDSTDDEPETLLRERSSSCSPSKEKELSPQTGGTGVHYAPEEAGRTTIYDLDSIQHKTKEPTESVT